MTAVNTDKNALRGGFLYLAYAALALLIPYASNGTVIALGVAVLGIRQWRTVGSHLKATVKNPLFLSLLSLPAYGALSAIWSAEPALSLDMAGRLGLLTLLSAILTTEIGLLSAQQANRFARVICWTGLALTCFYGIDIVTEGALASLIKGWKLPNLTRLARGAALFCCMACPIAFLLAKNSKTKILIPFFFAALFAVLWFLPTETLVLAYGIGLLSALFVRFCGKKAVWIILGFYMLLSASAPLVVQHLGAPEMTSQICKLPSSWKHRVLIWHYVANHVEESPIFGHGLNMARIFGGQEEKRLLNPTAPEDCQLIDSPLPLHPHNAPMQIWLELGGIGMGVFLIFLAFLTRNLTALYDRSAWLCATCTASTASFLTFAGLSFGVWQNWWLACGALLAGLLISLKKSPAPFS